MIIDILNEIKKSTKNLIEESYINLRLVLFDKKLLFFTFILIILFCYLAYFVYTNYITKNLNNKHVLNKELINNSSDDLENRKDALIVFFKTEWCPYCRQSEVEWNKFTEYIENINNTDTNKIQIKSLIIDCDKQSDIADKYEIEAYPTIKMFYKGEIYDYDARPYKRQLIQFVDSIIGIN